MTRITQLVLANEQLRHANRELSEESETLRRELRRSGPRMAASAAAGDVDRRRHLPRVERIAPVDHKRHRAIAKGGRPNTSSSACSS